MISKRAKAITPSMTLGISSKVKELVKNGEKILNLSIGEPDFLSPDRVKEAGKLAIDENHTKYDTASGNLELKKAICKKFKRDNNTDYLPENIVVSSGAKHSISNALMAVCDHEDKILVPVPYWVSYTEMAKICGIEPILVETKFENDFKLTVDDIKKHLDKKPKAIFLNNPSNPTGAIYTKDELLEICTFLVKNDIFIIADEIYEKIAYDIEFTMIASLSPEIYEKTITINGLSKSASMTGWRIGYSASNPQIAKAMGSIQSHLVSHPSTISMQAAKTAVFEIEDDIKNMLNTYKDRRNIAVSELKKIGGISIVNPGGAFYIFINIDCLRDSFDSDSLSLKVCEILLDEYKLALIPGVAFGVDNFIRMSIAADKDTILEGIKQLSKFVNKYRG